MKCNQVKDPHKDFTIQFMQGLYFEVNFMDMLYSYGENQCALAFQSTGNADDYWVFGQQFIKKYYFVYDQTPYSEQGLEYIQIGYGVKNPKNVIKQTEYANAD